MSSSDSPFPPIEAFLYYLAVVWLEWLTGEKVDLELFLHPADESARIAMAIGSVLYDPPGCYLPREYRGS